MRQLYFNNDTWYQIISVIKSHNVSNKDGVVNMELLKAWRDYLGGDHVIKQNNSYTILETIQDIDYEDLVYTDGVIQN